MSAIQPCPGCAATNQVQVDYIAELEAQLAAALEDYRVTSEELGVRLAERDEARAAVLAERQACAEIANARLIGPMERAQFATALEIRDTIRARGEASPASTGSAATEGKR